MVSLRVIMLVAVCVAELVSGAEEVPNGAEEVRNGGAEQAAEPAMENSVSPAVPEGSDAPAAEGEAITEAAVEGVDNGEQEGATQENGADATAADELNTEGAPQQPVAADGDFTVPVDPSPPSTAAPSTLASWAHHLLAAKYMAGLGVLYVAVCLYMAVRAGPLVVK